MTESEKKKAKNSLSIDIIGLISSRLSEAFQKYGKFELVLEDVIIEADELKIIVQPSMLKQAMAPAVAEEVKVIEEILTTELEEPKFEFVGKIHEVKIGSTKSEGGTRDRTLIVGGETLPPVYRLVGIEEAMPHRPIIGLDVFDMRIGLPRAVKQYVDDVMDDPAEWAKKCVNKFGAELINLHLISTDPYIKDTPPREAAKVVEEVLQAVKVPITVGGSGNPEKDPEVFKAVVDVAEGERIVLNSLNLDMKLEDICEYIKNKDCIVIAFTPMDLDKARELNRKLFDYLPKERILMDTNTAGIGYGLDYGFTVMERARLNALKGDPELQQPLATGVTNALAAREAWLKMDPFWGPREIRTPLWETLTGIINILAGADYIMTMHPLTMQTVNEIVEVLMSGKLGKAEDIMDWVSWKI